MRTMETMQILQEIMDNEVFKQPLRLENTVSTVELTNTFNISLVSGSTSMISCSMADTCRKKAHTSMNKTHTQCFRWPWLSLRFESPEALVFTPVRNFKVQMCTQRPIVLPINNFTWKCSTCSSNGHCIYVRTLSETMTQK